MPDLWLGLGSNLGDRAATLRAAVRELSTNGMTVRAVSSLYTTAPQGVTDQPEFLNCVARLHTAFSAQDALQRCQAIETAHGRERARRWGPRTLDLDVLFYDDLVSTQPCLELPHPRLYERAFVLAPLLELWPDLATPTGEPAQRLLSRLTASQRVERVGSRTWWHSAERAT
jgi:2-amino-4-hydroxy-6-hydroxymethyldihydropteridine diphosphokinase